MAGESVSKLCTARRPSLTTLGIVLGLLLPQVGCNKRPSDPTPEELSRRQQLRESIELSRSKTPQERLAAAQAFLAQGNVVEAQKELRPLLISQPDDPQVLLCEAKCRAAAGDKLGAAELLESITQADAGLRSEAGFLAARWYMDMNRYDAAEAQLQRLVELQGDAREPHRQLAMLLNHQGRRIEAAQHLRILARNGDISEKELYAMNTYGDPFIDATIPQPDFSREVTPAALAEAKRLRAEGELEASLRWIERLSESFPQSAPIAAFQGRVYADLQMDEQLSQWVATTPAGIDREPEYWFALGSYLQRLGRHGEAVRCFGEAVSRDETDRFSCLALARSLLLLGKHEEAERVRERFAWLEEAANIARKIGVQSGTGEELHRMASLLEQLGRPWEAIAWRQIALRTHGATEQQRRQLREQRERLKAAPPPPSDELLRTCGIDLNHWPVPELDALRLRETPGEIAAVNNPDEFGKIELRNVAAEVGLSFQYDNGDDPGDDAQLLHQLTGGGIGVIDFDLDGWPDLYMTQGGGDAFDATGSHPNELYRNLAGKQWISVTQQTETGDRGYGQGVAVADLNQDGFADLVVANIGVNVLYWNNGDGSFRRQPLADNGAGDWTCSIACGDLSGDQLPEIVEINYIDDPAALTNPCTPDRDECNPSGFRPARDHVWTLAADSQLRSWPGCTGMDEQPNYGFAGVIANIDAKQGNDLYIANDTGHNHYWISQPAGDSGAHSLVEVAQLYGCASGLLGQRQGCMGVAYGDFDRNGTLDLHVTNFWNQPADLYLQGPSGLFTNASASRGLYEATRLTVGWGTIAVDLDRDGWLDLPVLNGHLADQRSRGRPYQMQPQLFRGGAKGFQWIPPASLSGDFWSTPALGRMMASLDWNRDGKPDLVTNHLDLPVALLENRTAAGNHAQIELVGTLSERDAIGATVTVSAGGQTWTAWCAGGDGLLCSHEPTLDFGIGAARSIDWLEVHWPAGTSQRLANLAANTRYLIIEGDSEIAVR
jgi:tetratricopeptide (TPR) repeat protein